MSQNPTSRRQHEQQQQRQQQRWTLHALLRALLLRILLPASIAATTWLYLYPAFHLCAFPIPTSSNIPSTTTTRVGIIPTAFLTQLAQHLPPTTWLHKRYAGTRAPFRLLTFADPQLEGDTSLPAPAPAGLATRLRTSSSPLTLRSLARELLAVVTGDAPRALAYVRKKVDLWGNDYYLAHVARSMRWWAGATHTVVLGDLLGSQWIDDGEFSARSRRFWGRVFWGFGPGRPVVEEEGHVEAEEGETLEVLGEGGWGGRLMCVVGNHDVGYAGDMTRERVERFEGAFGRVNWGVRFRLPREGRKQRRGSDGGAPTDPEAEGEQREEEGEEEETPELRVIILNTMNLDTPALSPTLQEQTYAFINQMITTAPPVTSRTHATVLLTHIPLHKPPGVCTDAPFFAFHDGGEGVREQNHLSEGSSRAVLEGLFGLSPHVETAAARGRGRNGIILTGHDHAGCDVYHAADPAAAALEGAEHAWKAQRYREAVAAGVVADAETPGIREVTVRSMMGDFGGNVAMVSAWFDEEAGERGEWRFGVGKCSLGVQHWWWGVHILDAVTVGVAVLVLVLGGRGGRTDASAVRRVEKTDGAMEGKRVENGRVERLVGEAAGDSDASASASSTGAGSGSVRRKKKMRRKGEGLS